MFTGERREDAGEIYCDWHPFFIQRMIALLQLPLLDDPCASTPTSRLIRTNYIDHKGRWTGFEVESDALITVDCLECYSDCCN